MKEAYLSEAERILRKHSPDKFTTTIDAAPECIEYVHHVEREEAWKVAYPSLEAFYEAHEAKHPDIRVYGAVRREIDDLTGVFDPRTGTIAERIARLSEQRGTAKL